MAFLLTLAARVGVVVVLLNSVAGQARADPGRATAPVEAARTGGGVLSLGEVLRSARRLHPLVAQVRARIRRAGGALLGAEGAFDPVLSAGGKLTPFGDFVIGVANATLRQRTTLWGASLVGGWRFGRGDFPVYKLADKTSVGGEAFVGLELPLLRGGPIDSSRGALWQRRHLLDGTRQAVRAQMLLLQQAAARAYWTWVAAGRKLTIDQRLLDIALQRDAQIKSQVDSGALPRIERVDNQRAILKRRGAAIKARRAFEKSALKLAIYLRTAGGRLVTARADQLPKSLPTSRSPDAAQLRSDIAHARASRPELAVLAATLRVVDVDRRVARNARMPDLRASVEAAVDIGAEPYESRRFDTLVGLKLYFPLLMRKARGKLEQARAKLAELAAKRRLLRDKIELQVRDAYSALRAGHQQLEVAQRESVVAHRVEAAERTRLALGASTLLTVNLREQAAAGADKRAIDAAAQFQQALADYKTVTARGFLPTKGEATR